MVCHAEADLPRGIDVGTIRNPEHAAMAQAAEEAARKCKQAAEDNEAAEHAAH